MSTPFRSPVTRVLLVALATTPLITSAANAAERPNILWLFAEDTSPWMGCYGSRVNANATPNIDRLAAEGVRFSRAYVPAPVCSPCRSAMMVGENQIRVGAHEHRSSRGPVKITLPDGVKLLPQRIKDSGYFTFNFGKTDYNFVWDAKATYSLQQNRRGPIPWERLKKNQPFFGQIQTAGGKINTRNLPEAKRVDRQSVTVPADYPQNEVYREVVAQHHEAIRADDAFIGEVLSGLEAAGLADSTIVVYFSDHGANNLVRHKQMLTEGGLHVPFIIHGPAPFVPAPSVRDDLVNLLDLSATTLHWAGVKVPLRYEGQYLFADKWVPREFVAAAKDRLDHTIDRVRSVRTHRYRYTRNYKTDRILLQPQYRDGRPFMVNLRDLDARGELSEPLTEIYFGERPAEELYDVIEDPSQMHNLAADPARAEVLQRHRDLLDQWLAKGDQGAQEEPLEELAYQASGHRWGEGVNPEYEVVREDNDGDGLSDKWETLNDRDPADGRLQFQFDCGGWQTEGWHGDAELGNLAGRLGTLQFKLPAGESTMQRDGLMLQADKNRGAFVITAAAENPVTVTLRSRQAGATSFDDVAQFKLPAGERATAVEVDLASDAKAWRGILNAVQLHFQATEPTRLTVDSIEVQSVAAP